jgi:hypothetical protein
MAKTLFTPKEENFLFTLTPMKRGDIDFKKVENIFRAKYPKWCNPGYSHLPSGLKKGQREYMENHTIKSKRNTLHRNARKLEKIEKGISNIHDYSDSDRKRIVQDIMFNFCQISGVDGVGLLGPGKSSDTYLERICKIVNNFTSYELEQIVYFQQQYKYQDNASINIIRGDIRAAKPERFMDLDLMDRWKSVKAIILHSFKSQHQLLNGENFFTFTFCVDRVSQEQMNKDISECFTELLGTTIVYDNKQDILTKHKVDGKKTPLRIYKCNINNTGKYEVIAYKYKDSTNMITVGIRYKMGKRSVVKYK